MYDYLMDELATVLRNHGYDAYVGPVRPDTGLFVGHDSTDLVVDIRLDIPWQERMTLALAVRTVIDKSGRYKGKASVHTDTAMPGRVWVTCLP